MLKLDISLIRLDGDTQPRDGFDSARISQLMADITAGDSDTMSPVVVVFDGQEYWLADGFHRVEAHRRLNREKINAVTERGSARDAFLRALKLNEATPLTLADKKRAAERMVRDAEWSKWSDREIGRRCGVHNETVGDIRKKLSDGNRQIVTAPIKKEKPMTEPKEVAGGTVHPLAEYREKKVSKEPETRKVTRNGKTYEMNTKNVGKQQKGQRGKPKHLSTKAWSMLQHTPVATDENQKRQLERLAPKMQQQVARIIQDKEAATVGEAVTMISAGAPVDDWGRAYQAIMRLPADDRMRLCRLVEKETQEEAVV